MSPETIGDLPGTLNLTNLPMPVAVWSRGLGAGWTDEYDRRMCEAPTSLDAAGCSEINL